MNEVFPARTLEELLRARSRALDEETLAGARVILEDVRARGERAVREHAERLGDLERGAPIRLERDALHAAWAATAPAERALLERSHERIERFALAQRACLAPLRTPVDGGWAGHALVPVERVGAYAPGGRHPLPSTVLMTCVPARTAGVREILVASPRPAPVTLAAAALAGADAVLAVGGAQAIAALALGVYGPPVDYLVGPGNRWVTAAKKLLAGEVEIDMLAGPSELVVIADESADPARVAADLLAQAEHDTDALPVLITPCAALARSVADELAHALLTLPGADIARAALARGGSVLVPDLAAAVRASDRLAPEHLALAVREPAALGAGVLHAGTLFLGHSSAEVAGDYGAGPNHVLPTCGGARSRGGLSVLSFLRVRTWLALEAGEGTRALYEDARALASLEGLAGHARSAELHRDAALGEPRFASGSRSSCELE